MITDIFYSTFNQDINNFKSGPPSQDNQLDIIERISLFKKLALNLKRIHELGFVHNNLKLSNIGNRKQDSYDPVIINFSNMEVHGKSGPFRGS